MLTNAAACSQGKSPFIYRLFKDKKKLYLYNPPAHSLTNSYLPQPRFRRTIYETLKENTQLSHRLLAGRSCHATGFWWWQNCKCIKKDFFPAPSVWLDVCPGGYSGHLAGAGWEQTVPAAVCAAPTRLNEAVCLQSMGLSDPWMLGSSLFLFPADIYFKGAWPHRYFNNKSPKEELIKLWVCFIPRSLSAWQRKGTTSSFYMGAERGEMIYLSTFMQWIGGKAASWTSPAVLWGFL